MVQARVVHGRGQNPCLRRASWVHAAHTPFTLDIDDAVEEQVELGIAGDATDSVALACAESWESGLAGAQYCR